MEIRLEGITKYYGKHAALQDLSFTAADGKLTAILGPSGCGKTTLLRIIAGLIHQSSGRIFFGGKEISGIPAQSRGTAMVFQNYALFPHLSVGDNIAFGLAVRGVTRGERDSQVEKVLRRVDLSGLRKKAVQELSGGQRQRVALARALIVQPGILLFDEPLSNLDEKLRVSMRSEIRSIQRESKITTLYVTHDQEEALTIADRIILLNEGALQREAPSDILYYAPGSAFAAEFLGQVNIYTVPVNSRGDGIVFTFFGKEISMPGVPAGTGQISVCCRPEEFYIDPEGFPAVVHSVELRGPIIQYTLSSERRRIVMYLLNRAGERRPEPGSRIRINFHPEAVSCLGPESL